MTAQRGTTLVEVLLVTSVIGVLTWMISQSLARLGQSHTHTRMQARLTHVGDRVGRLPLQDMGSAEMVLEADTVGMAWLGLLDLQDAGTAKGARLPVATNSGVLDPDPPDGTATGNTLVLLRAEHTAQVTLSSGEVVRVDMLRFVAYLPVWRSSGELDLARWVSEPLARYDDIEVIEDSLRRSVVLSHLRDRGVRWCVRVEMPPSSGLHAITTTGSLVAPAPTDVVLRDPQRSYPALFGPSRVRLATNGEARRVAVPSFAVPTPDFPHGFEVRLDRSAAGGLLLFRAVICEGEAGEPVSELELRRVTHLR